MNFAPRDETPRLVVFVSKEDAIKDGSGLIHYEEAISMSTHAACKVQVRIWRVPMQPITCLECLCLNVA